MWFSILQWHTFVVRIGRITDPKVFIIRKQQKWFNLPKSGSLQGEGVLRFGLDRDVLLEPQNPIHFIRVIFVKKKKKRYQFLLCFFPQNIGPFFHNFWVFTPGFSHQSCRRTPKNLGKFWKNGPMFRDIFVENGTHV